MFSITRRALIRTLTGAPAWLWTWGASAKDSDARLLALNLFGDVFERIRSHYVDQVDDRKLVEAAVNGLLKAQNVDAHAINIENLQRKYLVASADVTVYQLLNYFGDLLENILKTNPGQFEVRNLVEASIGGMIKSLDSLSGYLSAEEFRALLAPTQAETGGIGVEVNMDAERVRVEFVIPGTPAERTGIMCGDIIIAVDGNGLAGLTLSQAVEKLQGPINSKVAVSVFGKGRSQPFIVLITRERISLPSVRYRGESSGIGYIRISYISERTVEYLRQATQSIFDEVPAGELRGFVIDLRYNTGGPLVEIIKVSDAFLERGEILSTRSRDPEETQSFAATPGDVTKGSPIVLLINGMTAAGAEMVAGALQDHRRARIVGTRSSAQGTIQTIIPLGSGNGALRLTTARVYRPSNRPIDGHGIDPDFVVEQAAGTTSDNDRACAPSVPENKSEDAQLQYALDLLRQGQR